MVINDYRATIAITRYREPDSLVHDVIRHACRQVGVAGEVLFLDQQADAHPPPDDCADEKWRLHRFLCGEIGLSAARNKALELSAEDYVLFLDADALADPNWALELCKALSRPGVVIAGSRIEPLWSTREPIIARSRVVRDQYSLFELGAETIDIHRVVGAGFGVRRDACPTEMYFDEDLGRRRGRLFGGEETDFCARVSQLGGRILYVGQAVLKHVIPEERERLNWILKRLVYAGHSRAVLGGAPMPSRRMTVADWLLMPLILPPYTVGWIWGRLFFDRIGGSRGVNATSTTSN